MLPVKFAKTALEDLRSFPSNVRSEAGYQLSRVQNNLEPNDWKPMPTVGKGARELRITDTAGEFRVIYVRRPEIVHVLHCFQKKTRTTSKHDINLAAARHKEALR